MSGSAPQVQRRKVLVVMWAKEKASWEVDKWPESGHRIKIPANANCTRGLKKYKRRWITLGAKCTSPAAEASVEFRAFELSV